MRTNPNQGLNLNLGPWSAPLGPGSAPLGPGSAPLPPAISPEKQPNRERTDSPSEVTLGQIRRFQTTPSDAAISQSDKTVPTPGVWLFFPELSASRSYLIWSHNNSRSEADEIQPRKKTNTERRNGTDVPTTPENHRVPECNTDENTHTHTHILTSVAHLTPPKILTFLGPRMLSWHSRYIKIT